MIQRIQTIYLMIVIFLSGILIFMINLWEIERGDSVLFVELLNSKKFFQILLAVLFLTIAILAALSLFLFKNRNLQIRINWVNIILNFILFVLLIFNLLTLSGEVTHSLKGIGIWLPLGSIVFLFLANRAIQKDENLVKSVDRIR
jgi:hypothetical protein